MHRPHKTQAIRACIWGRTGAQHQRASQPSGAPASAQRPDVVGMSVSTPMRMFLRSRPGRFSLSQPALLARSGRPTATPEPQCRNAPPKTACGKRRLYSSPRHTARSWLPYRLYPGRQVHQRRRTMSSPWNTSRRPTRRLRARRGSTVSSSPPTASAMYTGGARATRVFGAEVLPARAARHNSRHLLRRQVAASGRGKVSPLGAIRVLGQRLQ